MLDGVQGGGHLVAQGNAPTAAAGARLCMCR